MLLNDFDRRSFVHYHDFTIMFFIVMSSFTMVFESPSAMENKSTADILDVIDTVFTVLVICSPVEGPRVSQRLENREGPRYAN